MTGNSLGVEAIAEYQTITSTYGAEYGGSGSVINAETKAGTNSVHGSAYAFFRNRIFDAANRFDNPLYPTIFRRGQFGGSVGGPIRKNRDFAFASYEGFRQLLGTTMINNVPDANAHTGLVNGKTYTINPLVVPYLALYPACTPGLVDTPASGTCQYLNVNTAPTNEDYVNARGDHHISDKDSLFVRYVYDRGSYDNPLSNSVITGWPELDTAGAQFASIGETRMFSSNLINLLNISFGRTIAATRAPKINSNSDALLNFVPGSGQDGSLNMTGMANLGPAGATTPIYFLGRTSTR